MTIASEILAQLGGAGRIGAMINAKLFVTLPDGVRFKHMAGKLGANLCEIRLNARDLYDVKFYKLRGVVCTMIDQDEDVFVGDLRGRFRDLSNLAIQL